MRANETTKAAGEPALRPSLVSTPGKAQHTGRKGGPDGHHGSEPDDGWVIVDMAADEHGEVLDDRLLTLPASSSSDDWALAIFDAEVGATRYGDADPGGPAPGYRRLPARIRPHTLRRLLLCHPEISEVARSPLLDGSALSSGMAREKWEREGYLDEVIEKAVLFCGGTFYDPSYSSKAELMGGFFRLWMGITDHKLRKTLGALLAFANAYGNYTSR